jgi:hypothetical protein
VSLVVAVVRQHSCLAEDERVSRYVWLGPDVPEERRGNEQHRDVACEFDRERGCHDPVDPDGGS